MSKSGYLWRAQVLALSFIVFTFLNACSSSSPTNTFALTSTSSPTEAPLPVHTPTRDAQGTLTAVQATGTNMMKTTVARTKSAHATSSSALPTPTFAPDEPLESEELRVRLDEAPFLQAGETTLSMDELDTYIKNRATDLSWSTIKWTLYIPDAVDIDLAIQLFQILADNGCTNVAVYAEDAQGDWPKRDIGVELGPKDPVRVITQFTKEYPESVRKYTGAYHPENLLVASTPVSQLENILVPLLSISESSHIRVQEFGSVYGMPAERYLEILAELKTLGVTAVSFYGVYVE